MNVAATPKPTVPVRLVLLYQRAFEGRPSPCRFTPSCSAYALEALETHGTQRGLVLTLRRLVRCRPFGPSGWDPVPEAPTQADAPHPETKHAHVAGCGAPESVTVTSGAVASETPVVETCALEKGC
jgi:uncharacterized protein